MTVKYVVFQQDNRISHKSESVHSYLHQQSSEVMRWLALGSSLSPIEIAWAYLNRRLRKNCFYPRDKYELFHVLQKE